MAERLVVVVPTAYIPRPLQRLRRLASYGGMPEHSWWQGIEVFRPRYFSIRSTTRLWVQSRSACISAAPLCETLDRRHGFNLVLGNGIGPPAHIAQYVATRIGCPSICWAIGTDAHTLPHSSRENLRLFQHTIKHCHLVLCTSDALRRQILGTCPHARHVHTFYRGIDLADLKTLGDRRAARGTLEMDEARICMLMAGNVARNKGSREFYEAFKRMSVRYPALSAVWVGDGPDAPLLRRRAKEDGLADRLHITGRVPRPRVLEWMRAADLMLFPSHAEGLPNVVMEAMAAGLPVVSTDVGGVREIIADGVSGIVVPPEDVPAMTHAIERMLEDRAWARQVAERGRAFIHRFFDVDRNTPALVSLLRHLASGGSPESPFPPCADVPPGRSPIHLADGPPPLEP
jgi:glycosyltransferase involved in cell wall biosynthesis